MLKGVRQRCKDVVDFLLGRGLPKGPAVGCATATLGGSSYGEWTFCPDRVPRGGVIYSFGVGEDISWDLAMIDQYGVTIHAFDPTPRSAEFLKRQVLPKEFVFHQFGLADRNGTVRFYPPEHSEWVSYTLLERRSTAKKAIDVQVYRLETIMALLGHRKVDLIKMDVEGAEYAVINDLLTCSPVAGGAEQLLVEFHHRFPGKGIADTNASIEALEKGGFRSFHISDNSADWSFVREPQQGATQ